MCLASLVRGVLNCIEKRSVFHLNVEAIGELHLKELFRRLGPYYGKGGRSLLFLGSLNSRLVCALAAVLSLGWLLGVASVILLLEDCPFLFMGSGFVKSS